MRAKILAIGLVLGGAAHAAERAPKCEPFNPADFGKEYTATSVTPGQYHFIQGFWAANRNLPGDFPPGDGATILRKAGAEMLALALTKNKGTLVCAMIPIRAEMLKLLAGIKTGKVDEDGVEM